MTGLLSIKIENFRSLADIEIKTDPLNVLFGPNGAGKSTFLDTIWFIRDCMQKGVDTASSERSHGIGILWDKAEEGANVSITLTTQSAEYQLHFGYSSGRIEPFVGERLFSKPRNKILINRTIGSDKAQFHHENMDDMAQVTLREPEKLAINRYLDLEQDSSEALEIERILHFSRYYQSRQSLIYRLRTVGSETSYQTSLWERCENLWSVLRNLKDKRGVDERYDTIIHFMKKAFKTFDDLLIEQTGVSSVYGSFVEKGRNKPIKASGISDGHLQLLIHLTALFSEGAERYSLLMFDEPEISLHPWAIVVLANAIKMATESWNKQVFIATHSPILLSQFDPAQILAVEVDEAGKTVMHRVNQIEGIQDLLDQYAVGSLFMAQMIAPQSHLTDEVKA